MDGQEPGKSKPGRSGRNDLWKMFMSSHTEVQTKREDVSHVNAHQRTPPKRH